MLHVSASACTREWISNCFCTSCYTRQLVLLKGFAAFFLTIHPLVSPRIKLCILYKIMHRICIVWMRVVGVLGIAPWTISCGNGVMLPDIGTWAIRFGLSYWDRNWLACNSVSLLYNLLSLCLCLWSLFLDLFECDLSFSSGLFLEFRYCCCVNECCLHFACCLGGLFLDYFFMSNACGLMVAIFIAFWGFKWFYFVKVCAFYYTHVHVQ